MMYTLCNFEFQLLVPQLLLSYFMHELISKFISLSQTKYLYTINIQNAKFLFPLHCSVISYGTKSHTHTQVLGNLVFGMDGELPPLSSSLQNSKDSNTHTLTLTHSLP